LTLEAVSTAEPDLIPKIMDIFEKNIASYVLKLLKANEEKY